MKISAGKFKKRKLYSVKGKTTRPTTAFVREMIFSVVGNVDNFRVLDIFAGSGSLGFEALSRGAKYVEFIDFSSKSIKTILKNMELLNCSTDIRVHKKRINAALKKINNKIDLVLMDPPYNKNLVNKTLNSIKNKNILKEDSIIAIEHSIDENINKEWEKSLFYQNRVGNTNISILRCN